MRLVWPLLAVALATAGLLALTARPTVSSPLPSLAAPLPPPSTPKPVVPKPSSNQGSDCSDQTASLRPADVAPMPAAGVAAAPASGPAGYLRTILGRGQLTVAVRPDTPPFAAVDTDTGQFVGFEVELAKQIARALFGTDGHVQFRAVSTADRVRVVQRGEVDMSMATITITCDRLAQVDFSAVYFQASKNVLVLRSSPYRSLADLGGRKVCAATGTTSLQRIADTPTHPIPYQVTNAADCLAALQQGTVEGVVNGDLVLAGMAAQDPETRIAGPKTLDVPTAAAISRDHPELTAFVNGVLARMAADGTWTRLYDANGLDRVFGPAPAPPVPHYRDR
ncbi:glutamate ABC transporter substrate-binding protein [Frankia sp. R82]|uniref:glutamate ABC transporter substrate-binding protein n=1 Tax=Frankia sp. R82 TaxID=2950553 RepID=UPI00204385CA|nr:glutamate ABC transporter substrate-binding protein [Frankia sp. R82]MCM3887243.1 glutamate ABC transporter substrate-binding protein [Frankia sp. R82]